MGFRRLPTVVVLVVAVAVAFSMGYELRGQRTISTTTSTPVETTLSPTDPSWTAVWPPASSSLRFTTPTAAALDFATSVLGMTSPSPSAFQQGDARSGEVPLIAVTHGPVTTVFVRQLTSDGTWWVLGSACATISIANPRALERVASPLTVKGESTAFEGVVNYSLFQDDTEAPLASGTTMGGSNGVMGAFSAALHFAAPSHRFGTLMVYTRSAKDGSVLDASVLRVEY